MSSIGLERLQKQDVLLINIRCSGFNPKDFIEYIQNIKGECFDNLDAWDIVELQQVIDAFKQSQSIMKEDQETQFKPGVMNSAFLPSSQIMASQKMTFQVNLSDQFWKEQIECKQPQINAITNFYLENKLQMLTSKVLEYEVLDEGFFSRTYCRYKIEVVELGWNVWRRYTDFEWLRNSLQIQFPDSLIPVLPKKTLQNNYRQICSRWKKFDSVHISKRVRMFELFVTTLLNSSLLRTSDFVIAFFSFSDDQKFRQVVLSTGKNKQQTIYFKDQMKKYNNFVDYTTLNGQVVCETNPFLSQYYQQMNIYLSHSNDIYKKITDDCKGLITSLIEVQSKMQALSRNLICLRQITEHFDQNTEVGNLGLLSFSYKLLEDHLQIQASIIEELLNTFNMNYYEFFRFQRDMQNECLSLVQVRNEQENKYMKANQELLRKKEKYFVDQPLEKWQIIGDYDAINIKTNKKEVLCDKFMKQALERMLPQESKEVEVFRFEYGFVNKQLIEQFTEYFDNKGVVYITKFLQMLQRNCENLTLFNENLVGISSQLTGLLQLRCQQNVNNQFVNEDWIQTYMGQYSVSGIIGMKKSGQ